MGKIFTEENGVYAIDFSSADWATDKLFETFHRSGVELSDVDFVAEKDNELLMVCSIDEWNQEYGQYPVRQVMGQQDF